MDGADWHALLSAPGYVVEPDGPEASEAELTELEKWFGRPLPEEYAAFLRLSNGTGVEYQALWDHPSTEVPEASEGYRIVPSKMPGGILFGTHSIFHLIFDVRPEHADGHYPVLALDWYEVSNGWEAAIPVAEDFRSLLTLRRTLLPEVQMARAGMTNSYAQLALDLLCPTCGAKFSDWLLFQWGYCPTPGPAHAQTYHLGDAIKWKRCPDGSIRPWAYFDDGGIQIGDPTINHLITRDVTQFSLDPALHPRTCQNCGHTLEGAAVEIRDGRIQRAWIYEPGDLDRGARDFLIAADVTLTPMLEWVDHPLETGHDC